jgi:single-stranded-DNA-specific exonuclease
LLLTEDLAEARKLAETLDAANGNRQRIEAEVFDAAKKKVDALGTLPAAIILADPEWHPGVVGIVCTKLVERYDRPAILIGEGGRGSARTAKGLHLYDAINDCAEFLTKFGGHRAAAGLRIPFAKVQDFTQALLARVLRDPEYGHETESTLVYDDELRPEEIDQACFAEIMKLEPFGNGNPEPLFKVPAQLRSLRVVGLDHLKLRLMQGQNGGLAGIAFKKGELANELTPGQSLELAAHLELNDFSGVETLELRVRELRPSPAS